MDRIEASTLYDQIPAGSEEELKDEAPEAISISENDQYFVEPVLKTEDTVEPWSAPITIISAPGAVGKTSLAENISARNSVYLWDLARLNLGLGSFTGIIAESFGVDRLEPIVDNLSQGEEAFVFDAFDEAELKEGFGRIEGLIKECWKKVGSSDRTSLIFLARTKTADNLEMAINLFSQMEVGPSKENPCSRVEIDYFNEEKSKEFIDSEVSRLSDEEEDDNIQKRYNSYKDPFYLAIDSIFESAAKSFRVETDIWSENQVKSFLGYAPVLQAVTRYLIDPSHGNFHKIGRTIKDKEVGSEEADITTSLIEELLNREAIKVRKRIKEKVVKDIDDRHISKLYKPGEQLKRILLYINDRGEGGPEKSTDTKDLTPDVPGRLVSQYHSSLKSFVSQHPFIKAKAFTSPAFRDYLYAEALKWGGATDLQEIARRTLISSEYTPTPLLMWFYDEPGRDIVRPKDVGIIYESFSSRDPAFEEDSYVEIYPRRRNEEDKVHNAAFVRLDQNGEIGRNYEFGIIPERGDLEVMFPRKVENASIYIDQKLILGSEFNRLVIEDSEIRAHEIELRSLSVATKSMSKGQSVLISADDFYSPPGNVDLSKFGDGDVAVQWPGSDRHPWHDFSQNIRNSDEATYSQSFSALRRILLCFQRDKREHLARHEDYVDGVAINNVSIKEEMFKYLLEKGIVYHDSPLYKIDINELSNNEINWSALQSGDPHGQLSDFLESFMSYRK
jgi:hypothetical protein